MSNLTEIEAAADKLPPDQQQQLLLFLATRLKANSGNTPTPREFTSQQITDWITEDEADLRRFREAQ